MKQMELGESPPAKKSESRADQLFAKFVEYHMKNPRVWALFKQYAFDRIHAGHDHYSSDAIIQRIRWETETPTTGSRFKIMAFYRAYYARMFHVAFPDHGAFFRNKKLRSQDKPANGKDPEEFMDREPEDEESLMEKLRGLI
jgi:hypothetical protein